MNPFPRDLPLSALLLLEGETLTKDSNQFRTRIPHPHGSLLPGEPPQPGAAAMPGELPVNPFAAYKVLIDALLVESRRNPGSVSEDDKRYLYLLREACGRQDPRAAGRWYACLEEDHRNTLGAPPPEATGETESGG